MLKIEYLGQHSTFYHLIYGKPVSTDVIPTYVVSANVAALGTTYDVFRGMPILGNNFNVSPDFKNRPTHEI
jgi:hypothetical protein